MSKTPASLHVQLIDEEKKSACKLIREFMEKDRNSCQRVKDCLNDIGVTFLEELPMSAIQFILKMEESWENNTIEEVLIEEGIKRGFFRGISEKNLQ